MPLEVVASTGKRFVTDFGESHTAVSSDGEEIHIPRYGVWENLHHKAIVVHTTNNLQEAKDVMCFAPAYERR